MYNLIKIDQVIHPDSTQNKVLSLLSQLSMFFFADAINLDSNETCEVTNNCDPNADCIFEKSPDGKNLYRCRCRPGFSGDGHRCTISSLDNLPACALLLPLCLLLLSFQALHYNECLLITSFMN